jgi:hypothetical protein
MPRCPVLPPPPLRDNRLLLDVVVDEYRDNNEFSDESDVMEQSDRGGRLPLLRARLSFPFICFEADALDEVIMLIPAPVTG